MSYESNISPEEQAAALNPSVGTGTPDTAPWEDPAVPFLKREPIIAALIAANAPLVAGLAGSLEEGAPWWVQCLLGLGLVVVNGAGAAARKAVTPTARPRLDKDTPLAP